MKATFDIKFWPYLSVAAVVVIGGETVVVYWSLAWYWAVAIFLPAFLCISHAESKRQKQRIEEYFAERPVISEEEFGQHYFPPDRVEIATKLRKILVNHVGIDLSQMNPTDQFNEDLLITLRRWWEPRQNDALTPSISLKRVNRVS